MPLQHPFESDRITLLRRNRWLSAAAILAMLAAAPGAVAIALLVGPAWLVALAPLALFAGIALLGANLAPREQLGRVTALDLGLFFEGRRLASTSSIHRGSIVADGRDTPLVRIHVGRRTLALRVESALQGRRLLRALGVARDDVTHVVLRSPVCSDASRFGRLSLVAAALPLVFPGIGLTLHRAPLLFAALLGGALTLATALVVAVTAPARLTIERDRLSIRWLWRRATIDRAEVEEVRVCRPVRGGLVGTWGAGVALLLRSAGVVHLGAAGEEPDATDALAARLRDWIAEPTGEPAALEAVLDALHPAARDGAADQVARLRALGSGAQADHRTAPVDPDRLWSVIEDRSVPPRVRASAAVALSGSIDEAGRARLRVLADDSGSGEVADALAAVASGDEGHIEEVVAEVSARG